MPTGQNNVDTLLLRLSFRVIQGCVKLKMKANVISKHKSHVVERG